MARTVRLWLSDVIVVGSPDALLRVPATYLGQQAIASAGGAPYPSVHAAPALSGPQYFIGVARMSDSDVADTQAALPSGARFRQLEVADTDWDATLSGAQRSALNTMLEGSPVPPLAAGDTRRTALRRLARAIEARIDDVRLRQWLATRPFSERA